MVHGALYLADGNPPSILSNANELWYRRFGSRLKAEGGLRWPKATFLISNSSMRRSTLLACGGLDEKLLAREDFELGLRLWKMGVPFRYLPTAVASELSVKSWRWFLFKDGDAFGRTEVMLCRKHPIFARSRRCWGGWRRQRGGSGSSGGWSSSVL